MNTHTRSLSDEVQLTDRGLAFLKAIIDAQAWSVDEIGTFLDIPWKWDPEFALWLNNGAPTEPGDEFEAWVALMDGEG